MPLQGASEECLNDLTLPNGFIIYLLEVIKHTRYWGACSDPAVQTETVTQTLAYIRRRFQRVNSLNIQRLRTHSPPRRHRDKTDKLQVRL